MARRHGLALRLDGAVSPGLQDVVQSMERPLLRPENEQRTLNFLIEVRLIVRQIDGGGRTVILANRVDCFSATEGAEIFLKYLGTDPVRQRVGELIPSKPKQSALQEILGAVGDHRLGKWRRLNEEKPGEK